MNTLHPTIEPIVSLLRSKEEIAKRYTLHYLDPYGQREELIGSDGEPVIDGESCPGLDAWERAIEADLSTREREQARYILGVRHADPSNRKTERRWRPSAEGDGGQLGRGELDVGSVGEPGASIVDSQARALGIAVESQTAAIERMSLAHERQVRTLERQISALQNENEELRHKYTDVVESHKADYIEGLENDIAEREESETQMGVALQGLVVSHGPKVADGLIELFKTLAERPGPKKVVDV